MTTFRVLVTDEIDSDGLALLRAVPEFAVEEVPTLPLTQLEEVIGSYDAFVGRSATKLPASILEKATRLRVIGRAGVGTDNIDIPAATRLGIAIINAPAGNTIAVAELFFGELIGLVRHLPQAAQSMREGRWDRSNLLGTELRGRTLGIIGLGRIGGEVAQRARAFGMGLKAYDPYVTDERFDLLRVSRCQHLDELLADSDVVTIHTPLTPETKGLIGKRELTLMKRDAIIANLARGGIIDEESLYAALNERQVAAAILDVFMQEPLGSENLLRTLDNVLLTPHLGASTAEGQRNVAVDVCAAVRDALLEGELSRAINVVGGIDGRWDEIRPAIVLVRRMAAIARAILADRGAKAVDAVSLRVGRDLADAGNLLVSAAAAGALDSITDNIRLNLVNARSLAETRGIALSVTTTAANDPDNGANIGIRSGNETSVVAGVAPAGSSPRVTRIGDFIVDVSPRRTLLVLTNADVPGVIGRVGTLLGDEGVNIAEYHQARLSEGGEALAAVSVDGAINEEVRQRLLALPAVRSATVVRLSDLDPAGEQAWM
jgi:D-3-phosphoglycerate dehydrogenase / 2-oxoglutarate reductase